MQQDLAVLHVALRGEGIATLPSSFSSSVILYLGLSGAIWAYLRLSGAIWGYLGSRPPPLEAYIAPDSPR